MDPETKAKIEQLNKILKEKTQQIEVLKNEKSKGETLISSPGLDVSEMNKKGSYAENDSFEMDKIHLDLEEIKKFIRGRQRDDYEYKERIDSDAELRNNYRRN